MLVGNECWLVRLVGALGIIKAFAGVIVQLVTHQLTVGVRNKNLNPLCIFIKHTLFFVFGPTDLVG